MTFYPSAGGALIAGSPLWQIRSILAMLSMGGGGWLQHAEHAPMQTEHLGNDMSPSPQTGDLPCVWLSGEDDDRPQTFGQGCLLFGMEMSPMQFTKSQEIQEWPDFLNLK